MGRAADDDNDILIPSRDVISPSSSGSYGCDPLGVKSFKRRAPDCEARPSDEDRRSPSAKNRKSQHLRLEEKLTRPSLDSGLPLCPVDSEHPTIESASTTQQRAENVFGAFNDRVSNPVADLHVPAHVGAHTSRGAVVMAMGYALAPKSSHDGVSQIYRAQWPCALAPDVTGVSVSAG
jgi:hypothetical protein